MNNDTTDYKQVPSNSRGGREVLYDVIKGIGIILMVIGHTCGNHFIAGFTVFICLCFLLSLVCFFSQRGIQLWSS